MDNSTFSSVFTFQRTHKPRCDMLQIQMIGCRQGTLNLQSERITCKFAISNIQFVHMFSKSVFPLYWLPSSLFIYIYISSTTFLSLFKHSYSDTQMTIKTQPYSLSSSSVNVTNAHGFKFMPNPTYSYTKLSQPMSKCFI